MKKHFGISVVIASVVCLLCMTSACRKSTPLIACINQLASDSATVNQTITFSSCSQGATSYLWNFGDGSTATTATAAHAYTASGTYSVSFTPSNAAGKGNTETITIKVINNGGSWTFKAVNFTSTTCISASNELTATNITSGNTSNFSTITCYFGGSALPTAGGTYTVINGSLPTASNQVGIALTTGGSAGNTYYSTGGNGSNQTVSVTISGGKLSVTGAGIEMENVVTATDSASLIFSINQLQ